MQPSKKGTICLSTGTGKSKVAIDFIKENDFIKTVLITSPRTNLKENWCKELIKWGLEEWRNGMWRIGTRAITIIIENVQTAYKWKNKPSNSPSFDLIIADEIHTMMTPEYSAIFELEYKWLMGLTATHDITDKNAKAEYYEKYCPIIYEYYESAEDGLINKTRFFIVNHTLDNNTEVRIDSKKGVFMRGEAEQYEYLTSRIKKGQQLMIAQGSQDWFSDAANWFWRGNGDKEQKFAAMMYLNSIKYRKDFLQKLTSTANIAHMVKKGILEANEDSKVLIFSELTAQIEKITDKTVHSHNGAKVNQKRLDDFDAGTIRELGSCQSLTLGLNLKGATHGIMESYVGSATRSKQKKGRLDRLAADEIADLWIIVVSGTQIEKWFENMVKGFDLSNAVYVDSETIMKRQFDYGRRH
ncbi:MAG: DEAD/DEAH box helicase [Candidatus Heimdallarchaeaceae archaeon]